MKRSLYLTAGALLMAVVCSRVSADDANGKNNPASLRRAEQQAQDTQSIVARRETEITRLAEEFKKHAEDARTNVGDLVKETMAWNTAKLAIPALKKEARWLADNQDTLANKLRLLQAALEQAATAYRQAAKAYDARAEQEDDNDLKAGYLEMASRSRKLADVMEARSKRLDGTQGEVAKKLRFVEKSIAFLDDLEGFLTIYEPVRQHDAEMQEYLQRVNAYCMSFEQTLKSVWTLTDAVIIKTEESSSRTKPNRSARPAGNQPPPLGTSRPTGPQSRLEGKHLDATETIRGSIVRVDRDTGVLDVGLINLSRRHGVVSGSKVSVYRNGVQVASLTVGEQDADYSCVSSQRGRLRQGDVVLIAVAPRETRPPIATVMRP